MNDLNLLKLELDKIDKYKAPIGFEIITESNKRMFKYHVEQLIGRIEIRNSYRKKENGFVGVMMDQVFDDGVLLGVQYRLPTEQLISFENLMEVSIDLINKYDLIQCEIPESPDKKKRLENNLSIGSCESYRKFDIYDAYKSNVYNNNMRFMKKMKYIFTVLPYSNVENDYFTHKITEFIINCA